VSHYRRRRRNRLSQQHLRQEAGRQRDVSPAAWLVPLAGGVAAAIGLAAIFGFRSPRHNGSRPLDVERSRVEHERQRRAPTI
jgi:hypothetical protein